MTVSGSRSSTAAGAGGRVGRVDQHQRRIGVDRQRHGERGGPALVRSDDDGVRAAVGTSHQLVGGADRAAAVERDVGLVLELVVSAVTRRGLDRFGLRLGGRLVVRGDGIGLRLHGRLRLAGACREHEQQRERGPAHGARHGRTTDAREWNDASGARVRPPPSGAGSGQRQKGRP
jgi:hypothetical protein